MNYSINKKLSGKTFEQAVEWVTEQLKTEGFGIVSEINIKATLKQKINVDFRNYLILGACNPRFAHEAIKEEDKIGVFLPCNVVVQEHENGEIEVSAMDPIIAMSAVKNPIMVDFAKEIREKLYNVIEKL
ncbi:MAG: DUF302 domain-containing protein [Chloroflexia bacterium]|nr:DUF302 domain-containing protein [Chloroflexia bacterium]